MLFANKSARIVLAELAELGSGLAVASDGLACSLNSLLAASLLDGGVSRLLKEVSAGESEANELLVLVGSCGGASEVGGKRPLSRRRNRSSSALSLSESLSSDMLI